MEAVKKQQLEAAEKLFASGDLRRARMQVDMAMAMDRSGGGERACGGILKAQDLEPALTGAAQSPDLERELTRKDLGRAREGGGRAVRDGQRRMAASRGEGVSIKEELPIEDDLVRIDAFLDLQRRDQKRE
ncbi:hypothetical protein D1007_19342 [Hordeum vulgare]|nr:hypothetical protein D1007_19342 [Hordeum vulgare]